MTEEIIAACLESAAAVAASFAETRSTWVADEWAALVVQVYDQVLATALQRADEAFESVEAEEEEE